MTILLIWKGSSLFFFFFKWYVSFAEVLETVLSHCFLITFCAASPSVNRTSVLFPAPRLPTFLFQGRSLSVTSQSADVSPPPDLWRHAGSRRALCPLTHTLANLFTCKHERQSAALIREVKLSTLQRAGNRRRYNTGFWSSTERLFCVFLFYYIIFYFFCCFGSLKNARQLDWSLGWKTNAEKKTGNKWEL